jgi:hypothetical protein
MENPEKKDKQTVKERFQSFKTDNWVVFVVECLTFILLAYFTINFFIDLAKGIVFLGENNHAYEVAVTLVLLVLTLAMGAVLVFDIFFRNYQKEREGVTAKEIRHGRVIELNNSKPTDKAAKPDMPAEEKKEDKPVEENKSEKKE